MAHILLKPFLEKRVQTQFEWHKCIQVLSPSRHGNKILPWKPSSVPQIIKNDDITDIWQGKFVK